MAENKQALQAMLRRERVTPVTIKEKGKEFAFPTFGGGVSAKELAIFTRQFSVMIDAGLPLVQCLEILGGQQDNRAFQKALLGVRASVEGGSTLANALRQHPKVFDDLYTNMVEAGETGGILDNILQRLSSYIEKNVKLKAAVKSAMIYPAATLIIMSGVVILLLWKVVPIFTQLFLGLGADLPLPTRIASGVPILEGLSITARTSGNAVIEKALMSVRRAVEEGRTIVEPLKATDVFPSMVAQMIGVGEQTGALDAMLNKISDFYEEEVDAAVKDLLTAMEPIMLLMLGTIVGGIVISMSLPLFSLISKLGGG